MDREDTQPYVPAEIVVPKVRAFTRRDLLALSAAGVVSLMPEFGCGGGSHSTTQGGTGSSLTDAQRLAVLDEVGQKFQSLPRADPNADNQAMVKYLSSRSEFMQAAVSDEGTVSASFKDGRLLVLYNNRDPVKAAAKSALLSRSALRAGRAVPTELPTPTQARVTTSLGTAFTVSSVTSIRQLLENGGYNLVFKVQQSVQTGATVEELKKVSGDGVFFLLAHGGHAHRADGTEIVTVSTQSEPTLASEALYQPDMFDATLGYSFGIIDENADGTFTTPKRYCFTSKFISKYMRFGPNSFVMFNACSSAFDPLFLAACFSGGASVYAGWTRPANDTDAANAATYLIDRMLGANAFAAETPEQRAFDLNSLKIAISQPNAELGHALDTSTSKYGVSKLVFSPNPNAGQGDFALLAPTIDYLTVDEAARTLTINGIFGTTPDTVTMGGNALSINQWTGTQIICGLPIRGGGDVVVSVRGHASTPHRLTEWILPIHYHGQPTGQGDSHTESVDLMLLMRVDVLLSRSFPGGSVPGPYDNAQPDNAPGSSGNYAVSGQYEGDISGQHHVVTYTGSGALKPPALPALTGEISFDPQFDFTTKTIKMSFTAGTAKVATDTIGSPGNSYTTDVGLGIHSYSWGDPTTGLITMQIDDNYNILSGTITRSVPPGSAGALGQPNLNTTLTWDQTAPTTGTEPNLNQPRSAVSKSLSRMQSGNR